MALPLIAGAIAAPLIGGLIGADQANKERRAAEDARRQAMEQFANISIPDIEKQLLSLNQYSSAGQYSPEMEQLMQLGPTAMEGIALDPMMRQQQLQALEQMVGISSGEIQPGDEAAFQLATRNASALDQAKQGQILQEMQQRGQGGSGAELLARLKSSQSSADMLNQANLEQAAKMQQARMAALQAQSNMASGLRSQDYGEQTDLAKARDIINQFNTQNSQSVNSRNTGSRNSAQQMNLQNNQNLGNMNTELANKQQISNKSLQQQKFENEKSLAAARAGLYQNEAAAKTAQAGQTAGMWAGGGQAIGNVFSGMADRQNDLEVARLKNNKG
jgi:hypothetical protein